MDFTELQESLTDYFVRLEHGIKVARIRAAAVVSIVGRHAKPVCILDDQCCVHQLSEGDGGCQAAAEPRARAVQKGADHSIEAGCSSDDLLVVPADRLHLLRN